MDGEIHNHHVVPKIKGGTKTVPLCLSCHGKVHGVNFLNHKELTKRGLAEAKKRGIKLGNPQNLTYEHKLKGAEVIKRKKEENENWNSAKEFIREIMSNEFTYTLNEIANELNDGGYKTRGGKMFHPTTVRRLIKEL
jgi:hypothetical protein